jgi:hypothetical protein
MCTFLTYVYILDLRTYVYICFSYKIKERMLYDALCMAFRDHLKNSLHANEGRVLVSLNFHLQNCRCRFGIDCVTTFIGSREREKCILN